MADRWQESRDRQFRERELRRTYDYDSEPYGRREDRSFGAGFGEAGGYRSQGGERVFGERETGANYRGGPGQGYGGRGQGRGGSSFGQGGRGYTEGYGRSYSEGGSQFGRGSAYADEGGGWQGGNQGSGRAGDYDAGYRGQPGDYGAAGGTGGYDYERGYGDGYGRDDQARGFLGRAGEKISAWFGGDGDSHRGRGPKGYKRSDTRIDEDVHEQLTEDHWLDASHIEVKVANGEVTLSGTVDSRDAKRRAEEIAERASGVGHVQNNLRVQPGGVGTDVDDAAGITSTFGAPGAVAETPDANKKLS